MVFGVAIFLGFLLLATQTLVHLYATSVVTAVAFDEARRASADGGGCDGVEPRARERLGDWASSTTVAVECMAGSPGVEPTTVRIAGPSPARGLRVFGAGPTGDIDRTASFLTESEAVP